MEARANACELRTLRFLNTNLDKEAEWQLTISLRSVGGAMLVPVLEHAIVQTDCAQLDS